MIVKMSVTGLARLYISLGCFAYLAGADTTYYVSMLGRDSATLSQQPNPLYLFINNQNDKAIDVNITGSNCGDVGTTSVDASGTTAPHAIVLNCIGLIPTGIEIASKGLKVTSADAFLLQVVQADQSKTPRGLEGYLALRSDQLGNEYYISSYCVKGGWCQFSVLATENTSLNVHFPTGVTANVTCTSGSGTSQSSGTSVPFSLSSLDILHIESRQDLSGTYISSSSPVAVFAGARDIPSAVPDRNAHVIEQLLPTSVWGKEFIVVPNDKNDIGDLINIVTKYDNTQIEILGMSPFVIPSAGDSIIRRIDWGLYTYIQSDKPIQVIQYMFIPMYDTTTTNLPGMVLVQATNQWANANFFYRYPEFSPDTYLVSAVSNSSLTLNGDNYQESAIFENSDPDIERTDKKAGNKNDVQGFVKMNDSIAGTYGYIYGNIATLGNIVLEESEDCVPRFGYPGDGLDNNCNNQIDEETCTLADLETTFHLPYDVSNLGSAIFTKVLDIGASSTFYFKVITCGLLQIGLRSTTDESKFAALQVSQTYIQLQSCSPNCDQSADITVTGINDCTTDTISFKMDLGNSNLQITIAGNTETVPTPGLEVDRLLFMSVVRESNVTMDFTDKDCGKIISGEEDNYGTAFLIPIEGSAADSRLFVTNKGSKVADVTIKGTSVFQTQVPATDAITITSENITSAGGNSFLRMTSTEEVSVHYVYSSSSLMLLPLDILGPSYHYHLATANDDVDDKMFYAPVTENKSVLTKEGSEVILIPENTHLYNRTLQTSTLVEGNMPFVLFTGVKRLGFAQIPPKETLGKHFYIPAIDLDLLDAKADITVITTEDSTYYKILGEYHQETPLEYRGELGFRSLYSNEVFEIDANKPVQVELDIRAKDDTWGCLLVLPHVEQYVTTTVVPKLPADFSFVASYSINKEGGNITTAALTDIPVDTGRQINGTIPFFQLLVVKDANKHFIFPSDVKFDSSSNQVCRLSKGTPGDGLDNDCDNLNDEEECMDTPPLEDTDIDGDINEDCQVGTVAYVNPAPLLALDTNTTTCPEPTVITTPPTTATPVTVPPAIVVHHTLEKDWYSNLVYPPLPAAQAPPSFGPIEATAPVVTTVATPSSASTPSGSATPASTVAPVETCTTDCVCPCGWVTEKNYTQQELNAVILVIQEKLKLQKNKLSSQTRRKTSAPDDRPSATAVGYAGFTFLIITIGSIVLLDVTSIIRDLRMLRSNLQEVFNI